MPSVADANFALMSYVRETDFAEAQAGAKTLQDMRYTGESLAPTTATTRSREIRVDRQTPAMMRTNVGAQGDTQHEVSFADYDALMESAIMADSAFGSATELYSGTALTITASGATAVLGATGIHTNAVVGEWVLIEDAAEASNNGYWKITAVGTDEITVGRGDQNPTTESPGADATVTMLASIVNGTTLDTYFIERSYTDLDTATFEQFFGMAIQQWSVTVPNSEIATQTFGWLGARAESADATGGDGSNIAQGTRTPMNTVDDVVRIIEGSGGADFCVQSLNFTVANNLRARNKVGALGAFEAPGRGRITVTGSIEAFFQTREIMDAHLDFTDSHIAFRLDDADGNVYIVDFPRVKYTSGERVVGGEDTDIIANIGWEAYRDATEGVTVRIVKHAAT